MPISLNATFLKQPNNNVPGVLGVRVNPQSDPSRSVKATEVAFAIDTSGSMEGDRLDSVKHTLSVVVDMLKPDDKITIISFSQTAAVALMQHTIKDDESKIQANNAINNLTANGGTNLESGIFMLGNLYKNRPPPDAIVVLTDGHINEGITTFSGLNTIIETYFMGVPTYTLGYGTDHNADLLKRLAEQSRANYTFIKSEISLPITLGDLYGGLRTEVAAKAMLNYPASWTCLETLSNNSSPFALGSLIADKPVWVMFSVPNTDSSEISLTCDNMAPIVVTPDASLPLDIIEEQSLRCMIAKTMVTVADYMKTNQLPLAVDSLKKALKMIEDSSVATNEFVVHMKAQLTETLEQTQEAAARRIRFGAMNDLYYRTTSLGGNYVTQRGRTQMADGTTPQLFSSEEQAGSAHHYSTPGQTARDPSPPV